MDLGPHWEDKSGTFEIIADHKSIALRMGGKRVTVDRTDLIGIKNMIDSVLATNTGEAES